MSYIADQLKEKVDDDKSSYIELVVTPSAGKRRISKRRLRSGQRPLHAGDTKILEESVDLYEPGECSAEAAALGRRGE